MSQFPSLKDELQGKPRTSKASDSKLSDQAVEENSQVLADKWVGKRAEPATPIPPPTSATEFVSLRGYIPEYLDRELAIKAATTRVTKTYLILEALQKAGYHIEEADISTDRRRNKS